MLHCYAFSNNICNTVQLEIAETVAALQAETRSCNVKQSTYYRLPFTAQRTQKRTPSNIHSFYELHPTSHNVAAKQMQLYANVEKWKWTANVTAISV
jgi:hypothetical protein